MLSLALSSRRLVLPFIRSQFALPNVKSVQPHLKPLQLINLPSSLISRAFNVQNPGYNLVQAITRNRALSRLLLKSPTNNNNVCRSIMSRPHQLRSFISLPRRTGDNEWATLMKLPLMQRFKILFKKYWYIVVPLHIVLSAAWFGLFWVTSVVLAKLGVDTKQVIIFVNPYIQDSSLMPDYIKKLFNKNPETLGHFAFALLFYKLTTLLHYVSTVFVTFYLLRFLLRAGIIVKSSSELSTMVKDSYLNHAIHKNIKRRAETIRYRFKKHRPGK